MCTTIKLMYVATRVGLGNEEQGKDVTPSPEPPPPALALKRTQRVGEERDAGESGHQTHVVLVPIHALPRAHDVVVIHDAQSWNKPDNRNAERQDQHAPDRKVGDQLPCVGGEPKTRRPRSRWPPR